MDEDKTGPDPTSPDPTSPDPTSPGASLVELAAAAVTVVATDGYARVSNGLDFSSRVAGKLETLIDETILTLQATRPLLQAAAEALESGIVDEIRDALGKTDDLVELAAKMATQLDHVQVMVDATSPALGLVNTTIEQVNQLPGASFVRRRITRAPHATDRDYDV